MKIGLVADSQGDVDALEYACDFLLDEAGAERIFFLGGRWADLDELFQRKRAETRGRSDYTDADFLADITAFVEKQSQAEAGGAAHRLKKGEYEAFVARFARVPDADSLQYRDPTVARVLADLVGDRIACLVHDKSDLNRENVESASLFFHGSSPEPEVVQIGPRFFATPGKLSGAAERSFALFDWQRSAAHFVAYGVDGRELKRRTLEVVTRNKMSAR